jgi:hypothetical protein
MPQPTKHPASPWTDTKRSFIASMPGSMPNEIVAAGKDRGLKLTLAHVYAVRSLERRKAIQKKNPKKKAKVAPQAHPGPAARSRRVRRARPSGPSPKTKNKKSQHAGRAASGRRGQRDLDFGGLLPGLVMIGGYRYAEEIAALQVKHGFADPILEAILKASGAMLGLPRAIKILSIEQGRVERSILEALR